MRWIRIAEAMLDPRACSSSSSRTNEARAAAFGLVAMSQTVSLAHRWFGLFNFSHRDVLSAFGMGGQPGN